MLGLAAGVVGVVGAIGVGCLFPPEDGYPVDLNGAGSGNSGGGGAGGSDGGGGSGGSGVCTPGTFSACYTGPTGTEGVGICRPGTRICSGDGLGYGPCEGEVHPGTEVCGNSVPDEDCSGAACPGEVEWALAATGTGEQTVYDVAVDSSGNTLVAGVFTGSVTLGGTTFLSSGGLDALLAKVDAAGNPVWLKRFGGLGDQVLRGVAVDGGGNVYLAGYFAGSITIGQETLLTDGAGDVDMFVAKLSPQGDKVWARDFGSGESAGQLALGIAVNGGGDAFITGSFNGSITFGGSTVNDEGNGDMFLAGMDTQGTPQWIQRWGSSGSGQRGTGVAVGNAVFVCGEARGYFNIGNSSIDAGLYYDILAMRADAGNGTPGWASSYGDPVLPPDQYAYDLALDPLGNVLLTGQISGTVDFGGEPLDPPSYGGYIVKFSDTGQHAWSKTFGDNSLRGRGIAADSASNVLLTGDFLGAADFGGGALTAAGGVSLFVAKLGPDGNHLWSRRFGDEQDQIGVAVAVAPTDHALVAGHFRGQLDFGTATLSASGAAGDLQTLFLAKLAP